MLVLILPVLWNMLILRVLLAWNSLPKDLHDNSISLLKFKSMLKTHLFVHSFTVIERRACWLFIWILWPDTSFLLLLLCLTLLFIIYFAALFLFVITHVLVTNKDIYILLLLWGFHFNIHFDPQSEHQVLLVTPAQGKELEAQTTI